MLSRKRKNQTEQRAASHLFASTATETSLPMMHPGVSAAHATPSSCSSERHVDSFVVEQNHVEDGGGRTQIIMTFKMNFD